MKGGFGQHCLTGNQGLSDVSCDIHCPRMVMVPLIAERYNKAGIGDSLHRRENPFREDKSGGPLILPARLRNR